MKNDGSWESVPTLNIRLGRADAIVLYDWLMETDLDAVPVTHPAQQQALRATGRHAPEPGPVPRGTGASTDMGNVTHALPAIHPGLGIDGAQGAPHTRQFAEDTVSPAADEATLTGALALAWTGLDLVADPEWRARALAPRRTGGRQGPPLE